MTPPAHTAVHGGSGPAGGNAPPLLDAGRLQSLVAAAGLDATVVAEIDSTNAALARAARATATEPTLRAISQRWRPGPAHGADLGEPRGQVLVAEVQTAGRGRLDRTWQSRPGAGLTVSLLVRPAIETARLGWLPMVVGTSLVSTLRSLAGVPATLKWPNDVLVDGVKLAGILTELVPAPPAAPSAVIGFGLNVHADRDELPERSTSLRQLGAAPAALDRTALLGAILNDLMAALAAWTAEPGRARDDYRMCCATLGRQVRLELPGGASRIGIATDVDPDGRLIVGDRPYSAADVVHLR